MTPEALPDLKPVPVGMELKDPNLASSWVSGTIPVKDRVNGHERKFLDILFVAVKSWELNPESLSTAMHLTQIKARTVIVIYQPLCLLS